MLAIGNPAKEIIDRANKDKAQMIVIGLRGLHGIDRVRALGSVSRRVLENAECTVVVVPC